MARKGKDNFFDDEERKLDASLSSGEWKSVGDSEKNRILKKSQAAARSFMNKDSRINIRLSSYDLQQLKYRAMQEGIPYQTLISSILHKYVRQPYKPQF